MSQALAPSARVPRWAGAATAAAALLGGLAIAPAVRAGGTELFVATAQISELLGPATDAGCQPSSTQPGATASGTINGQGVASVIGAFTVASVDCIRSADPNFTPPFHFSSTQFVLTARKHRQNIMLKLGLHNGAEIAAYAMQVGLAGAPLLPGTLP